MQGNSASSREDRASGDAGATPAAPRVFGKYLLLARIGEGGMGEVWLAKHGDIAGIEKHCVLKMLRPSLTYDPEYVSRFIDEARVVVALSHRNICSVFDVGRVGDRYYLAMEHVAGRDLRTIVHHCAQRGAPLPQAIGIHVAGEVLEALDSAHRHRDPATGDALHLVHRDVSLQNVMVNAEGEVKLIDFGLAASSKKSNHTQPSIVMGKAAYMPPEQARGLPLDATCDQFSAAVVAYELVSGERFYGDQTPNDIWLLAGTGGYRPPAMARLPAPIARVLDRALSAAPTQRFPTCGALRDALLDAATGILPRVGARELRELMATVYGEELFDFRRHLRAAPPGVFEPTEATQTFAVAPQSTASARSVVDERTARQEPPPRRRSALALITAAAAAAVVAALVAVVVPSRSTPPTPAPTMVPPPPTSVSLPTIAAPPASTPDTPPVTAALPAAAGAVVDDDAARGQAAPPEVAASSSTRAEPARAEAPRKRRPPRLVTFLDKKAFLQSRCAKLACTTSSIGGMQRIATLSQDEAAGAKGAFEACVRTCVDASR